MCHFLSAIVLPSGEILCDPEHTDSHEDLLEHFNIRDTVTTQGRFCRVEFTPPEDHSKILDFSTWFLKVDEESTPEWFDHEAVRAKLTDKIKGMIIQDHRKFVLGGCWILVDGAEIGRLKNGKVALMIGMSTVEEMCGTSKVGVMRGTSKVEAMYESSKVGTMYDSSKVGVMLGTSKVGTMYDSSKVEAMHESSKVEAMYESSKVEAMLGTSKVGTMHDSSTIISDNRENP
jgi:hypothetical protein